MRNPFKKIEKHPSVTMWVTGANAKLHFIKPFGEGVRVIPVGEEVQVSPKVLQHRERCGVLYKRFGGWMLKSDLAMVKPVPPVVEPPPEEIKFD